MANRKYEMSQQKFAEKLFQAYPDLGKTPDAVFAKIASCDPTSVSKQDKHQYIYLEWICSRILRETPREQDLYKIREDLNNYALLARLDKFRASRPGTIFYRPFVNPEIGQYTIASLAETILPYETQIKDRKKSSDDLENERQRAEEKTLILYDGPEGRIVVPTAMEASQYWGKGTKWCISATKSDNRFEQYYNEGKTPIIMFLPKKTQEKYAFNEHDQSAARNMLDVGILDPYYSNVVTSPHISKLGDFVVSALQSSEFNREAVDADPHLAKAFQGFAIWNPQVYNYMIDKMGHQNLPEFMGLKNLSSYCEDYLHTGDESAAQADDAMDEKRDLVRSFLILENVFSASFTKGDAGVSRDLYDAINEVDAIDIVERITHRVLAAPETPFDHADDYISDFKTKMEQLSKLDGFKTGDLRDLVSNQIDEAAMVYMQNVPKPLWTDEEFALEMVMIAGYCSADTISATPEAYNHPKILHHALDVIDIETVARTAKGPDFKNAWMGHIDGVPFLEIVAEMKDFRKDDVIGYIGDATYLYEAVEEIEGIDLSPIVRKVEKLHPDGVDNIRDIERIIYSMPKCDFTALLEKSIPKLPKFSDIHDVTSALDFYKSIEHIDGLDLSPLARQMEEIYPNGFDNTDEIEAATAAMMKCDLTKLLEKSVRHHPELFADIAPEKQTMNMAIAAVQHDPGSLADMAAHLFKGDVRPPELTAAFNKLPPDSIERGAVADYFKAPEVS